MNQTSASETPMQAPWMQKWTARTRVSTRIAPVPCRNLGVNSIYLTASLMNRNTATVNLEIVSERYIEVSSKNWNRCALRTAEESFRSQWT